MSLSKPLINGVNLFSSGASSGGFPNYFSNQNSTNKILTIGAIFAGIFEDVINYSNLILNIKADVNSEVNGVIIEFGNLINVVEFKYEYTYKFDEIFLLQIPISTKYFRIRYINGSKNQNTFGLMAMLASGSKMASNPDSLLDAFGRLRISDVKTLMDLSHTFDNGTINEDEKLSGGASASTYNSNASCIITLITELSHSVTRQSRKYSIYQPGKSLLIKYTCVLNALSGGNDKYTSSNVGYYDDKNGYFFRYSENSIKIVYRSSSKGTTIDEEIPQTKWNLNSLQTLVNGYILNPARVQIYFIDLQWLGVGRVRMGVVHNGQYIFCHEFLHDNILDKVYITTANLPIRHDLFVPSSSPTDLTYRAQCKLICASVISEGGYDPIGMTFSTSRGTTVKLVSNSTETFLLAIRLKTTRNRTMVIPTNVTIVNKDTSPSIYYLRLFRAPTNPLTNASWTSVNSNSAVEYDISSTVITTTNNITVSQGYFVGNSNIQINIDNIFNDFLQLTSNIDGVSDILTISAQSLGASNQDTYASIQWKEVF